MLKAVPFKSTWEGECHFFYFSVGCGGETIFFCWGGEGNLMTRKFSGWGGGGYLSWLPFALNSLAFHRNKKIYPFCCLREIAPFCQNLLQNSSELSSRKWSYLPLKMATSVSVVVWLEKIGLQSLSPIFEGNIADIFHSKI